MPNTCCKGCIEKRMAYLKQGINCHSVCEEYLEAKKELEKKNKEIKRQKKLNYWNR